MARVADARVIQVAQQSCDSNEPSAKPHYGIVTGVARLPGAGHTCAPVRTLAEEGGHAVVAGSAAVTGRAGAVIDVLAAVVTRPPVDAHAVVAAVRIVARASVLTRVGHQLTLVHVFGAVLACERSRREYRPQSPLKLSYRKR